MVPKYVSDTLACPFYCARIWLPQMCNLSVLSLRIWSIGGHCLLISTPWPDTLAIWGAGLGYFFFSTHISCPVFRINAQTRVGSWRALSSFPAFLPTLCRLQPKPLPHLAHLCSSHQTLTPDWCLASSKPLYCFSIASCTLSRSSIRGLRIGFVCENEALKDL